MESDNNLTNVLKKDGVRTVELNKYENLNTVKLSEIKKEFGSPPWAVRIILNEIFGGVLIAQNPGEGNRLHYHSDTAECWVIMEGKWEWYIEGIGTKLVEKDDIVLVEKNQKHKITCIGDAPGIRFAITKPNVNHIYV